MGRARDISKVFSTSTALATDTEVSAFNYLTQSSASTVYQTKATAGLTLLTPTSIANTSGTASIGANGTITVSGVSSVSLNNVFNSTYRNYKIIVQVSSPSADDVLRLRWRKSASDSTTEYYGMWSRTSAAATTGALNTNGESSVQLLTLDSANPNTVYGFSYDALNPFVSTYTSLVGTALGIELNSAQYYGYAGASHHRVTETYDGLTLLTGSGATVVGTISVYGYNQ